MVWHTPAKSNYLVSTKDLGRSLLYNVCSEMKCSVFAPWAVDVRDAVRLQKKLGLPAALR